MLSETEERPDVRVLFQELLFSPYAVEVGRCPPHEIARVAESYGYHTYMIPAVNVNSEPTLVVYERRADCAK